MRKEAHLIVLLYFSFHSKCCHLTSGEASVKVGVPNEEVAKRILQMPTKFTTACRVYTSFSSRSRPPVAIVQEAMEELQEN